MNKVPQRINRFLPGQKSTGTSVCHDGPFTIVHLNIMWLYCTCLYLGRLNLDTWTCVLMILGILIWLYVTLNILSEWIISSEWWCFQTCTEKRFKNKQKFQEKMRCQLPRSRASEARKLRCTEKVFPDAYVTYLWSSGHYPYFRDEQICPLSATLCGSRADINRQPLFALCVILSNYSLMWVSSGITLKIKGKKQIYLEPEKISYTF